MTIAIINTDMNIGPFKIPGNGQNMILNNYAERNQLLVDEIIPEPFKSNALATTQWMHKKKKLTIIILCSIHQLPQDEKRYKNLSQIPKKIAFARPMDEWLYNWSGPKREEFIKGIDMSNFSGNQKWLIFCLEYFLNYFDN